VTGRPLAEWLHVVGGTRGVGLQAVADDGHAEGGTEHQHGGDEGPVGGHGAAVVLQNDKAQRSRGLARPSPDHARKKNARNEDRRRSNPKESIHRVAILSKTAETCHSRAEGKPSIIRKSAMHPRLDKA